MTPGLSLAPRRRIARTVALLPLGLLGASAISCSDSVPVAAQGNFSFQLSTNAPDAPSGTRCQHPNKVFGFGEPSTSDPGKRTSDGDDSVSVSCKVRKSGDSYVVSGSVQRNLDTFYISSTDLDVTSGVGSAQVSATSGAEIGYETCTPLNCPNVTDPPLCTVEVIADQVRPGALWAKVTCPMVVAPSEQSYCTASAIFVLENCEE